MADYCYGQMYKGSGFKKAKGYDIIGDFNLPDLSDKETEFHVPVSLLEKGAPKTAWFPGAYKPRFNMVGYQRQPGFTQEHGEERFAVIFARYDGIALYDILFGNHFFTHLFILLNQEYSFGGNYDTFSRLMQKIAVNSGFFPRFILTEDRNLWRGYHKIYTDPLMGGMHRSMRYVYSRIADQED